jgi:tRNA-binding protein
MLMQWEAFDKIDIRIGTIIQAQLFEKATKKAYQLVIDFGGQIGTKKSSAQITALYTTEVLVGMQVLAVINFRPKQIANFFSECLVLGVHNQSNQVVLLKPTKKIKNGAIVK